MITLGIESTAHTFGVGIVEDEDILANARSVYEPEEGGIHPWKAAEHHYSNAVRTVDDALEDASLDREDIDCIAFSQGPGMPQSLQVGGVAARSLSQDRDIPLVGVNHCIAHIEIGRLTTDADDPVTLYVSGGNSQIIAHAAGRYRIFGETLDIAVGNAIDKFGRSIDIPHPAGPRIEELAAESGTLIDLPYIVKGMDFSFSGLVTALKRRLESHAREDLCHSFQEYAFAMLVEATERAMAHLEKDAVLLTGGVAANQRLQDMLDIMASERGGAAYKVPHEYCMDNGAMIAHTGRLAHEAGYETPVATSGTDPDWRTDEVDVPWMR
jgi:universal protein Kae1